MKTTLTVKVDDLESVAADASNSSFVNDASHYIINGKLIPSWLIGSIAFNETVLERFPIIAENIQAQADAERDRILEKFQVVNGRSFSIPVQLHKFNWLNFWRAFDIHHRRSIARRKIARYYTHVTRSKIGA